MNIEESNVLIAEFMGMIKSKYGGWSKPEHYVSKDGEEYSEEWHRFLKYHSSWDWLMDVVHKIKDKEKDYPLATSVVLESWIWTSINIVYDSVVQFIQWYNQQNPQHHDK